MTVSRQIKLFKVFIGFYECINHLKGRGGIYVVIQLAVYQKQFASKTVRVVYIGRFCVPGTCWVSHPLFIPPDLIHPVIVTTAQSHAKLVEIAMEQQCREGVLSPGRVAVNTHSGLNVHRRIFSCCRLHPKDTVRETRVFQVPPAYVVESLGAVCGTHAVYSDHNKAHLQQFGKAHICREIFGNVCIVRPGINVFHNGILVSGIIK